MIRIKATVKGEPDVPPFTRAFEYNDRSDEEIFFSSAAMVKEKLEQNLKINTNEALVLYCTYAADQLRAGKSIAAIKKNASRILSPDQVMIGVSETLQTIILEVMIDNFTKKVTFKEPIPTSGYILAEAGRR